ncbi:MAG: hypothetical protein JWR16_3315 [Nevskia sp.]|nr:hypothetical protein [Nevskia sp.]
MRKPITLAAIALLALASTSTYAASSSPAKGSLLASRSASSGMSKLPLLSSLGNRSGTTRTVVFRDTTGGITAGVMTLLLSQDGLLNPDKPIGKLILGTNSLIPNGIPILGGALGKPFGGFLVYVGTLPGLGKLIANL